MENKIIESAEDSLSLIRNKVKEAVVKSDFRKKIIGGISEDDVEDYINMMQLQWQYRENKLNEQIDELITLKDKLRVEFNTYIQRTEEEKKKLLKDLQDTKQSLEDYMNQCEVNNKQMSELEEYKALFEYEKSSNAEMNKEIETLKEKLQEERFRSSAKDEAVGMLTRSFERQEENNQLNAKSRNFNTELNALYKELESVKEQVEINSKLKQQLELERKRTEKVESEMTDFFKRVLELKDSISKSNEN